MDSPLTNPPNDQSMVPIGVSDMVRDPWIGFAIFIMFVRAAALAAIAAHLSSSVYGAGLGLVYALARLGEHIIEERAQMHRERVRSF